MFGEYFDVRTIFHAIDPFGCQSKFKNVLHDPVRKFGTGFVVNHYVFDIICKARIKHVF